MSNHAPAVQLTFTLLIGALCGPASADNLPVALSLSADPARPRTVRLEWSAASTSIDLLPGAAGNFERAGDAYFGTPDAMLLAPANQPRWTEVAACSPSDGAYVLDVIPGGGAITPQCVHQGYLWPGRNMKLYRSIDGQNWEWISDQPLSYVFSLNSGTLLGTSSTAEQFTQLWRSTDNGATWATAMWAQDGTPCIWPNQNAYVGPWGFHQAQNGTIIAVEYETPVGGRHIYRSADDGQTWNIVHNELQTTQISHFHALSKHEALGRWIAATGDGHPLHHFVASDDDGLTWYDYTAPQEIFAQPMALLDYGDPERLLFGSDLHWQVGEVNVSDGPNRAHIRSVLTNWDSSPAKGFCFVLFQHEDVYYACQIDLMLNNRQPVISVSRDRVHWAVYHRFTADENGVFRYCGFINGKLHLAIQRSGSLEHFAMRPAQVSVRSGLALSPPTANLLETPAGCSGESVEGWINASPEIPPDSGVRGALESSADFAHYGNASLHYSRSDGGDMVLWSPSVAAPPEGVVRARAWVRGDCASCWLRLRHNYADVGLSVHFSPNTQGWQEIVSAPLGLWGPLHELRASLTCTSRNNSVLDVYVDSIQVEAGPTTPWHVGGARRAAESCSGQIPAGAWTHLFTIQPEAFSDYLYDTELLQICTYTTTAGDIATVLFDPLDRRFKVRAKRPGHSVQYLETLPQKFQRLAQIRFAIRCGPDGMRFSIVNGQPLAHATSPTTISFPIAATAWAAGGVASQNLMPAVWLDSALIPASLSNDDLETAVSLPLLPADWQPDSVTIERRAPDGAWQPLATVPALPAEFVDKTGLPSENLEYRAVAATRDWGSSPSNSVVVTMARAGDMNGDNVVDLNDLVAFLATFGLTAADADFSIDADFTGDATIDLSDLTVLLTSFGT